MQILVYDINSTTSYKEYKIKIDSYLNTNTYGISSPLYKVNNYYMCCHYFAKTDYNSNPYTYNNSIWMIYSTDLINWNTKLLYHNKDIHTNDYKEISMIGVINNKLLMMIAQETALDIVSIASPTDISIIHTTSQNTSNNLMSSYGYVIGKKAMFNDHKNIYYTEDGINLIKSPYTQDKNLYYSGDFFKYYFDLEYNAYLIRFIADNHEFEIYNRNTEELVKSVNSKYTQDITAENFIIDDYIYCTRENTSKKISGPYRINIHDLLDI